MGAPEPVRGCAKSAAPKTSTGKAAGVASTKTASTKVAAATATEVPTTTSAAATTAAGPCRLTKRNKSGDYKAE
jgi:hypothetical protein